MTFDLPADNWPSEIASQLPWPRCLPYGWAHAHAIPNTMGFEKHFELYHDIVQWVDNEVPRGRDNVLWEKVGDCIYLMFRKERDYLLFALKFGL